MLEHPATQFALFAVCIWGCIALLKAVRPLLPAKVNGNGSAGTQSTDYWKSQMGEIVDGRLENKVVPILERQTEILGEMAKGINELVIIQRDDRVRKAAAGKN